MNDEWDYTISGKTGNTISLIFLFAVSAFLTVLSVDQLIGGQHKSVVLGLFLGVMALSSIVLFVKLAVMFFFVKVRVGKKGFYFQSNPFNGKYYEYTDVKNGYEELKKQWVVFLSQVLQHRIYTTFILRIKTEKLIKCCLTKLCMNMKLIS